MDLPAAAASAHAPRPLPGVGFHGGEQELAGQAHALDPQPRLCAPRRPQPARHARGGRAPAFSVDRVEPGTAGAREVYRTSPSCYLNRRGCRRARASASAAGARSSSGGNSHRANFICIVPPTARVLAGARIHLRARPARLGRRRGRVEPLGSLSSVVVCATDWIGFAREDIPEITRFSSDLSGFPRMPDRTSRGSSTSCSSAG